MPHRSFRTRRHAIPAGVLAVAIAGIVVTAPQALGSPEAHAAKTRSYKLSDFKITPANSTISAGKTTFAVHNSGGMEHEMVVIKTNKKANALPVKNGRASEKGEVEDVAVGKTKSVTLNLKPGHYVLICNIPGHYKAGMRASLTVR